MKPGRSSGRLPAKVEVSERATDLAGFTKDVEAVNQYATPIQAAQGIRSPHAISCVPVSKEIFNALVASAPGTNERRIALASL